MGKKFVRNSKNSQMGGVKRLNSVGRKNHIPKIQLIKDLQMLKNFKALISATLTIVFALAVFLTVGVNSAKAAGILVSGAKVGIVQNTSSNGDNFAIKLLGGTGACANQFILFPATGVSNRSINDRGLTIALTALAQELSVDAYDYISPGNITDCAKGGQISVTNP